MLKVPVSERSFSLNSLDKLLDEHIKVENGFFIEAGANNGIAQSNTLFFEQYRGWTGLLVEPIPELARQCKSNRKNCIVENFALVPFDYSESSVAMRYSNLMSLVKGAMRSSEEEELHVKRGCEVQGVKSYDIEVDAVTLSSLLDKHSITSIDLLSLDVEGFELNVLKGIDFSRHKPTWMLIEARYRDEIDNFLSSWYEVVAELSHHDVLYRLRES